MKHLQYALEKVGFIPTDHKHPEDVKEDKERKIDGVVKEVKNTEINE